MVSFNCKSFLVVLVLVVVVVVVVAASLGLGLAIRQIIYMLLTVYVYPGDYS